MFVSFCCLFIVRISRGVNIYICIEMSRDTYYQPIRETLTFLYVCTLQLLKYLKSFPPKNQSERKKRKKPDVSLKPRMNENVIFLLSLLFPVPCKAYSWNFIFIWVMFPFLLNMENSSSIFHMKQSRFVFIHLVYSSGHSILPFFLHLSACLKWSYQQNH